MKCQCPIPIRQVRRPKLPSHQYAHSENPVCVWKNRQPPPTPEPRMRSFDYLHPLLTPWQMLFRWIGTWWNR